jgi:hypothetical protein
MLDRVVAEEVPADVVRRSGAADAAELLRAVDVVRADEATRGDLELLALMGDRVRSGALALADVEEALADAEAAVTARDAGAGAA